MEREMALASCNITSHASMKVNGKLMLVAAEAWKDIQTVTDMKASSLLESLMVKAFTHGQMARYTKVNGLAV